jgi:hypothetical protein
VKVRTRGTVGLLEKSIVNFDGIGAVISFTPKNGKSVLHPVLAGSSYASQNSLEWLYGLGKARKGTIDVLWPGGVRNKLYNVRAGERINFPEIPCSYADKLMTINQYKRCVKKSLNKLVKEKILTGKEAKRFIKSAIKARRIND